MMVPRPLRSLTFSSINHTLSLSNLLCEKANIMRAWAGFWFVGFVWGSSFMLIRIGVESIHPLHLVLVRVGIAALGLALVVIVRRKRLPRDWRTIRSLVIIGVCNTAIPFTLITWGEKYVESGIASVLQATAALFTLVIAHFAFEDERITPQRLAGLVIGFLGVAVLASRNWQTENGLPEETGLVLLGMGAVVLASLFYAIFTSFSRKVIQGQVEPIVVSAVAMISASVFEAALVVAGSAAGLVPATTSPDLPLRALLAVVGLGVVNTFLAYLVFYEIVRSLGAARAAMVTYIVPPVGLFLGVVLLNEPLDAPILIGAGMIFAGIAIVNLRFFQRMSRTQPVPVSK